MLFAILTIVGGLLAASSLIIAKRPDAKDLLDKVAPYQGFLGLGLLGYGVYHLVVSVLPNLGALTSAPLSMGLGIGAVVLDILIGFVLGFGLLSKLVLNKSEAAKEKGKALLQKLVRVQVPLGVAAVAVGALVLVW